MSATTKTLSLVIENITELHDGQANVFGIEPRAACEGLDAPVASLRLAGSYG